jgi:bla regulator protein blaR1
MASELLGLLIEGLVASSAAIILVLLLRPLWRRSFGAASAPLLWLIVPLALVAVMLPAPVQILAEVSHVADTATATSVDSARAAAPTNVFGMRLLMLLWLLGSALAVLVFALQQRRFRRSLGDLRDGGRGFRIAEHTVAGPAVIGLLRPAIVVPADFEQRYSTEQRELILCHERSHLRRGDLFANALATALRSLYWFNPLIHYAAARMRHDHELASDAAVLQKFPHARRCYADALLNTQLAVPGLPVGCLWQSSHPLKERIQMFKQPAPTTRRRRIGIAIGFALALATAWAAWAAQPAQLQLAEGSSSGSAPTARPATHKVSFKLVAEGESSSPVLHVVEGQSFGIAVADWEADFTFDEIDAGHGSIAAVIRRAGELIARPTATFEYGKAFPLELGADAGDLQIEASVAALDAQAVAAATELSGYRVLHPPLYPKAALKAGQSGKVVLRVKVDTDGAPLDIAIASATLPGVFDAASIEAARAWRFNPARAGGRSVIGEVMVPICFSIQEDSGDACSATEAPSAAGDGV